MRVHAADKGLTIDNGLADRVPDTAARRLASLDRSYEDSTKRLCCFAEIYEIEQMLQE